MKFSTFFLTLAAVFCYVGCLATSGDSNAGMQQGHTEPNPEEEEPEFSRLSFEEFQYIYGVNDVDAYLTYLKNFKTVLGGYVTVGEIGRKRKSDLRYVEELFYYLKLGGGRHANGPTHSSWQTVNASRTKHIAYLDSLPSLLRARGDENRENGENQVFNAVQQRELDYIKELRDEVQQQLQTYGDAIADTSSSVEHLPGDVEFFFEKYNKSDPTEFVTYISQLYQITGALSRNETLAADVRARFAMEYEDNKNFLSKFNPGQSFPAAFDFPAAVDYLRSLKAQLEKSNLSTDWAKNEEYKTIVPWLDLLTNEVTPIPVFVQTPLPSVE